MERRYNWEATDLSVSPNLTAYPGENWGKLLNLMSLNFLINKNWIKYLLQRIIIRVKEVSTQSE